MKSWKKFLAIGLISGSFLFQNTTTCTERAQIVTAVSSLVSMGGIIYIVDQVMND